VRQLETISSVACNWIYKIPDCNGIATGTVLGVVFFLWGQDKNRPHLLHTVNSGSEGEDVGKIRGGCRPGGNKNIYRAGG